VENFPSLVGDRGVTRLFIWDDWVEMVSLDDDEHPRLCRLQFGVLASSLGSKDKPDSSLTHVSTLDDKVLSVIQCRVPVLMEQDPDGSENRKERRLTCKRGEGAA
jgi:hypothetical protein